MPVKTRDSLYDKKEQCIRIALEYRALAALRVEAEEHRVNPDQQLQWRDCFPERWASTTRNRVLQVLLFPLVVPLLLIAMVTLVPVFRFFRRRKIRKVVRDAGGALLETRIRRLAQDSQHATLQDFWQEHGLPKRTEGVEFKYREECLERWISVLYGREALVALGIGERVTNRCTEHAHVSARFSAAGGSISFLDPLDSITREVSQTLPSLRALAIENQ